MKQSITPTPVLPLEFGKKFQDHAVFMYFKNGKWTAPICADRKSVRFSVNISSNHYGQAIFEGMKATLSPTGEVLVFSPEEHGERFISSAKRMGMPPLPMHHFLKAFDLLLQGETRALLTTGVTPHVYIRPSMINIEETLDPNSTSEYVCSFTTKTLTNTLVSGLTALAELEVPRAEKHGVGTAKNAGNYGRCVDLEKIAKEMGFSNILYLIDYLQEFGTMNVFFVEGDELYTPALDSKVILPGITRRRIITLARKRGIKVHELEICAKDFIRKVTLGIITEVFGCGTASIIIPYKTIGVPDGAKIIKRHLPAGNSIASMLYDDLLKVYRGELFPTWSKAIPLMS